MLRHFDFTGTGNAPSVTHWIANEWPKHGRDAIGEPKTPKRSFRDTELTRDRAPGRRWRGRYAIQACTSCGGSNRDNLAR